MHELDESEHVFDENVPDPEVCHEIVPFWFWPFTDAVHVVDDPTLTVDGLHETKTLGITSKFKLAEPFELPESPGYETFRAAEPTIDGL